MALHYVTLTGKLPGCAGARFKLEPESWVVAPGEATTFPPRTVEGVLKSDHDGNGVIGGLAIDGTQNGIEILATDNADESPTGWTWTITWYGIPGVPPEATEFLAPANGQDGVTLDVASITPVVDPTQVTNMLLALNNLSDVANPATALANIGGISNTQVSVNSPSNLGYKIWTADRWTQPRYAAAAAALPTGNLIQTRVTVPAPITITGFLDFLPVIQGTGGAGCYAGLYDPSGHLVAASADFSSGTSLWRTISLGITSMAAGNWSFVALAATQATLYTGPEPLGGSVASNSTATPGETGNSFSSFRCSKLTNTYTTLPSTLPTIGWGAWYMNMGCYIR